MVQRIRRVDPLQMAKVLGALYAVLGAIFIPFFLIIPAFGGEGFGFGLAFAIAMPILYGIMGAVAGLIGSAVYNLIAGWVGGIEVELVGATTSYDYE